MYFHTDYCSLYNFRAHGTTDKSNAFLNESVELWRGATFNSISHQQVVVYSVQNTLYSIQHTTVCSMQGAVYSIQHTVCNVESSTDISLQWLMLNVVQ